MKRIDDVKGFFSQTEVHDAYITSTNICEGRCDLVIESNSEANSIAEKFLLRFQGLENVLLDLKWDGDIIISHVHVHPRYRDENWNINIELSSGGGRMWGVCPSINLSFSELYFSEEV